MTLEHVYAQTRAVCKQLFMDALWSECSQFLSQCATTPVPCDMLISHKCTAHVQLFITFICHIHCASINRMQSSLQMFQCLAEHWITPMSSSNQKGSWSAAQSSASRSIRSSELSDWDRASSTIRSGRGLPENLMRSCRLTLYNPGLSCSFRKHKNAKAVADHAIGSTASTTSSAWHSVAYACKTKDRHSNCHTAYMVLMKSRSSRLTLTWLMH